MRRTWSHSNRTHRRHDGPRDRGASKFEIALFVPVFFAALFWFVDVANAYNNGNSMHDGLSKATHAGAVGWIGGDRDCSLHGAAGDATTKTLMCMAKESIGLAYGDTYVKVRFADMTAEPPSYGPENYVADGDHVLLVCAQRPMTSVTGLYNMFLKNRWQTEKVAMRIETLFPGARPSEGQETLPVGADWNWCQV